jgi:DNA repair protein RadC
MTTLYVRENEQCREANEAEVLACARRLIGLRYRRGSPVLTAGAKTHEFLRLHLGVLDHEVFGVFYLDSRHRLIRAEDLFRGTIDGASIHVREVVKGAVRHNAAAMICYHNHPSGFAEPSANDDTMTRVLKQTLAIVDVRLLDHLIVGESIYSYAEHGRL